MKNSPRNKADFYGRYSAGEFGNRPQQWHEWESLRTSSYQGKVTIRSLQPGGPCHYGYPVASLRAGEWPANLSPGQVRFNESMPDEHLSIQGNVWLDVGGLRLEFSREKGIGHRQAVSQPYLQVASGLLATSLLQYLDCSSRADLYELLEMYPDSVVEFSTYTVKVGVLPHRNTVFWEVRAY